MDEKCTSSNSTRNPTHQKQIGFNVRMKCMSAAQPKIFVNVELVFSCEQFQNRYQALTDIGIGIGLDENT